MIHVSEARSVHWASRATRRRATLRVAPALGRVDIFGGVCGAVRRTFALQHSQRFPFKPHSLIAEEIVDLIQLNAASTSKFELVRFTGVRVVVVVVEPLLHLCARLPAKFGPRSFLNPTSDGRVCGGRYCPRSRAPVRDRSAVTTCELGAERQRQLQNVRSNFARRTILQAFERVQHIRQKRVLRRRPQARRLGPVQGWEFPRRIRIRDGGFLPLVALWRTRAAC